MIVAEVHFNHSSCTDVQDDVAMAHSLANHLEDPTCGRDIRPDAQASQRRGVLRISRVIRFLAWPAPK